MCQTRLYFKDADQYTYEQFGTSVFIDDALLKRILDREVEASGNSSPRSVMFNESAIRV